MHVFLTGDKGVGKSRAAREALRLTGRPAFGFRSRFETADYRASSLYLLPADGPLCPDEAHLAASWVNGKLTAVEGRFDTLGVSLLREARSHPEAVILMDECGHAEKNAMAFRCEILACLDGDTPVLGVLRKGQAWHEEIKNHPRVILLEVTPENRDSLPARIAALLTEDLP